MSIKFKPNAWSEIDRWWETYAGTRSVVRTTPELQVLEGERLKTVWDEIDSWWAEQTRSTLITRSTAPSRTLCKSWLKGTWEDLDPWWAEYTDTGHEVVIKLADLLGEANEAWANSNAPFDTDPLAADVTRDQYERGPVQPTVEPEWSRWLAQLLHPSSEFVSTLFDIDVDQSPATIAREDRLLKSSNEAFRRPDIVAVYENVGLSIEVKLGDENYRKTPETARIVEENYNASEWTHVLLLPESQLPRLETIVGPPVESSGDGRLQVQWDDPGPIDVLYWRDVTSAARNVLRRGAIADDHWAANAYLFCAVAEQQLTGFQPQPVVNRLAEPTDVVDMTQPISMAATLEEQLTYLRKVADP